MTIYEPHNAVTGLKKFVIVIITANPSFGMTLTVELPWYSVVFTDYVTIMTIHVLAIVFSLINAPGAKTVA